MDFRLYELINGLSGNAIADRLFELVADELSIVLMALVALTFLVRWSRHQTERRSGAVLGSAAATASLLVAQPIAHAVDRARPYISHPAHAHLLVSRSHDPSFPSDHAAGAFALALGVWVYDRTFGTLLLLVAGAIAFSRVFVGTHYPSDVVAGALLGAAAVALLHLVPPARRFLEGAAAHCGRAWDSVVEGLAGPFGRTG